MSVTNWSPPTRDNDRGTDATVAGVTMTASVKAPVPAAVFAAIRYVYVVPLIRPVIERGDDAALTTKTQLAPSSLSMRYDVIVPPPVSVGAVQLKLVAAFEGVAVSPVGAAATVTGTAFTVLDAGAPDEAIVATLVTAALTANTLNQYLVPFVRPVTIADVAVGFATFEKVTLSADC